MVLRPAAGVPSRPVPEEASGGRPLAMQLGMLRQAGAWPLPSPHPSEGLGEHQSRAPWAAPIRWALGTHHRPWSRSCCCCSRRPASDTGGTGRDRRSPYQSRCSTAGSGLARRGQGGQGQTSSGLNRGPFPPSRGLAGRPLPCAHTGSHRGWPAMTSSTDPVLMPRCSPRSQHSRTASMRRWRPVMAPGGDKMCLGSGWGRGAGSGSGCCHPSPDPGPPRLSPRQPSSLLPHSPAGVGSPSVAWHWSLLSPGQEVVPQHPVPHQEEAGAGLFCLHPFRSSYHTRPESQARTGSHLADQRWLRGNFRRKLGALCFWLHLPGSLGGCGALPSCTAETSPSLSHSWPPVPSPISPSCPPCMLPRKCASQVTEAETNFFNVKRIVVGFFSFFCCIWCSCSNGCRAAHCLGISVLTHLFFG